MMNEFRSISNEDVICLKNLLQKIYYSCSDKDKSYYEEVWKRVNREYMDRFFPDSSSGKNTYAKSSIIRFRKVDKKQ